MIDLIQKEKEIISGLKDFQQATVERVHHLFTHDYARVLVADEVGLGKTMIARGVIAKMARYHRYTLNDDLFKVVYVCSNQSIAGQNLAKLKIDQQVLLDGLSDTRLSMQHLKIFENKFNPKMKDHYIQLIPLTPSTSFDMTGGCGSVLERALMFAILKRYHLLQPYLVELETLMMDTATKSWDWWKHVYEERVEACDAQSNKEYRTVLLGKVDDFFKQEADLVEILAEVCRVIRREGIPGKRVEGASKLIHKLRKMMAEISVDLMDADLVIMDEFQRFPELIDSDGESETALLASKFFNSSKENEEKVNILLLSATPYKLYSTMEEMSETGSDDHYKEFMQVTDFLFEKHPEHQQNFKKVWHDYSFALSQLEFQDFAMVTIKKQKAEDSLYKGIARTERMLVEGASELIDSSVGGPLRITENDVLSYIEMDRLLEDADLKDKVPAEYVKSAPFLMSFMEHYKLKQKITHYFRENRDKITLARKPVLWVNRKAIANYEKLPAMNAKLTNLQETSLPKRAERLMWIPPSIPYYELRGPFTGQSRFSKVLAFSAWEMVPRAIATLISYEAERRTVGELIKKTPKKKKDKTRDYFAERRFPSPRLTFAMKDQAPANMNHLTLLYPSITLAKLFNPVDVLNRKLTLAEIKGEIQAEIQKRLDQLPYERKEDQSRQDERWYYLAPLLFDLGEKAIQEWFEESDVLPSLEADEKEENGADKGVLKKHLEELRSIFVSEKLPVLGRQPDNLLEVLVHMVLGSPAVAVARMLEDLDSESLTGAIHLAKVIVDRFNTQEAISIVELEYGTESKDAYWQNVLKYCVDGNIQAMLDEYAHMLLEEGGLNKAEKQQRNKQLIKVMANSLKTHTASYNVDTYQTFKNRIMSDGNKNKGGDDPYIKMRTNYAVGFYDTRNEDKTLNRKENIRLSFNSPFRPFVLATTSIGQEGLDFHYYCRKIFHWNLTSNPIDLEQREGRINRYKSLAIRQNIANKYGVIKFEKNIWQEMFHTANFVERDDQSSELVPFWSLPGNQDIKIERIVPLYPLSRDGVKYDRLMKILALYRLSLGQARQEELIEYIFKDNIEEEQLKKLFINLSPFYKKREKDNM